MKRFSSFLDQLDDSLEENYRALAQKGIGAERKEDIKVGHGVDYYHPKDGSKHMGKIHDMDDKGYTVKDDKTGEKHKFDYFRKEEVELEEAPYTGKGNHRPGWMLRADPELAKKFKEKTDAAKLRQKYMGKTADEIAKMKKEEVELDEISLKTATSAYKKMADGGNDMKNRTGLAGDQSDRLLGKMKKKWGEKEVNKAVREQEEVESVEEGRGAYDELARRMGTSSPGFNKTPAGKAREQKRRQEHLKGQMQFTQRMGGLTGPKGKLPEEVELEEADFSKAQTKMAHAIGKHFKSKGIGDESKGGPFAVASAMVRDKPEAAKKAYATIKAKMKSEDSQDALMSLYDDLNEDNQVLFMEMLEEDAEKLLTFAKSRVKIDGEE